LARYAAQDPIVLNGTGSYDPDNSGLLSYDWQQISGPSLRLSNATTPTPTVDYFYLVQTDEIQECEFELVVSDGELESNPDSVKIIIVPDFGPITLEQENPPFDSNKPTIFYFSGGDCVNGFANEQKWGDITWCEKANVINFQEGYKPDASYKNYRTYYHMGDMIIVFLSSVAPAYHQPIQTIGWSTGEQPAMDAAIRINSAYKDSRYAINRVTALDAPCRWEGGGVDYYPTDAYIETLELFLGSAVDGEQCWCDSYAQVTGHDIARGILGVNLGLIGHAQVRDWYRSSLTSPQANTFNNGIIGGAYWSVIGPGKNLQLTKQAVNYMFRLMDGTMYLDDEELHPARLPESVTLVGPVDVGDPNGAVLTCEESENAVGYQLLFGSDPYRVMDYSIVSDTSAPPDEVITTLPFDETWWTVRVRDQYGSTIYADPKRVRTSDLSFGIENQLTGKKYAFIQDAIDDTVSGEIVVKGGIYHENIDFKGKNLIIRSTDPSDSAVVAATILAGDGNGNPVTFSYNEDASCVLAGFTITDANNGIYCSGASPTIANCNIVGNVGNGLKLYMGSNPTISNCIISGNGGSGIAMLIFKSGRTPLYNSPTVVNCTIVGNSEIGISEGKPTVLNSIIHSNGVQITGSYTAVQYSNIQDGFPGEGNIDVEPLFANPENGDYHLKSQAGRWEPISQSWILDDVTSLCIDAGDPTSQIGFEPEPNGNRMNMGAYGGTPEASKSP
jgi:parallel beta-helix repeat protein